MSVNIVTPWYINKVKNVLFHCYFLFQVNMYKWWIFLNRFHHFQCLKAQSLLRSDSSVTPHWKTQPDVQRLAIFSVHSSMHAFHVFFLFLTFVLWSPFYSAENFENFERTSLDCGVILKLCVLYGTHAVVQLFFPCS